MRQAVLLLHGTAASSSQWRSLAEKLAPDYDVIAPDLWGCGGAPHWDGRGRFSLEAEALPVIERIFRRGNVHVVAHSYGGAVALHIARTRRPLVRSMLLYEPAAFHLLRDGDASDQLGLAEITGVAAEVAHAIWQGRPEKGMAAFIDYWNGAGTWAALPPQRQAALADGAPKVSLDFQAALADAGRVRQLQLGAMPRTLVHGDRSPLPAIRITTRLAQAWPRAEVELMPGAGHMGPVTHRDAFEELVLAHLAFHSRQPLAV